MKKVSIIIVTYNSEKDIYDCILSIQQQADIPINEIELIIVDNNSEHTDAMFRQIQNIWGQDVILIKNTKNGGYGQGNNLGIRNASAPILLIMNPDVRLFTPFFKKPLSAFEHNAQLVMYGMKQLYTPMRPSQSSFCTSHMMNGYLRSIIEAIANRLQLYLPRWMYFSGSCFYIRKSKFQEIGLFDEDIFMYGEENDLHYKLCQHCGPHFSYDKHLKYLHLTSQRPPSAAYELKLAEVAIVRNTKKGISRQQTIQNLIRWYRMRYWRESLYKLFKNERPHYAILRQVLNQLSQMKKQPTP